MNVVLFNYRGSGQSKGEPSDQKYHKDIETVYQFAKKRTGQEDSKILFKGLCFGGGASAYAAGKHPKTNIILDQSYTSFRDIVEEQAALEIEKEVKALHKKLDPEMKSEFYARAKEWVKENIVPIVAKCTTLIAPNFEVGKNLTKNSGHKAIFYIHDDALIPLKSVKENIKAAHQGGGNLKIFASPGKHGDKWINLKAKGEVVYKKIHEASEKIEAKYSPLIEKAKFLMVSKRIEYFSEIDKNKFDFFGNDKASLKAKELEDELAVLSKEAKEIEDKKTAELGKLYSEVGFDKNQMEKAIRSTRYHARDQMLNFLEKSDLSDSLI
jgi:hypothetical protein